MSLPEVSPTTQWWYDRLPHAWRDLDAVQPSGGGYPLLRYLSLLGDVADEIAALVSRFAYVDPSSGGAPGQAASYHATVEGDTPAGYWRFNDPAGVAGPVNDVNGLTAVASGGVTLGGPNLPPLDPSGGSGSFDGTGVVTTPYAPALSAAGAPVSLEAWIDPAATGAGAQTILGCVSGDNGASLSLEVAGGVVTGVVFTLGTGSALTALSSGRDLGSGTHRVLATYDGTTMRLSVDGALLASEALAGGVPFSGAAFVIGTDYVGSLSDVAVYASALSSTQDAAHESAATVAGGSTSDLVDPRRADDAWLPWLAQQVGATVSPSTPMLALRAQVETPSAGWQAGVKAAIAAAAQTVLSGDRYCQVSDHYGGDQWTIEVQTRASETPSGAAVLAAVINGGAKPAGCALVSTLYESTWGQVDAAGITWATYDGVTWQYVSEVGA